MVAAVAIWPAVAAALPACPVREYFAAALARYDDLHFDPPAHVAVGAGSVSFVYASVKNLTAVETLVFARGSRVVTRAHCHYRG